MARTSVTGPGLEKDRIRRSVTTMTATMATITIDGGDSVFPDACASVSASRSPAPKPKALEKTRIGERFVHPSNVILPKRHLSGGARASEGALLWSHGAAEKSS